MLSDERDLKPLMMLY